MKKRILVVSFALALSANLRAQVTIGALTAPASGALLDLNSGVTGGLVLSNVTISDLSRIPYRSDWFPGIDDSTADTNPAFTGAMVYHIGGNNIPAGIYVWNGTNWTPAEENCTPLVNGSQLTLTTPVLNIKQGDTETFSVSSDASARCTGGETYAWSVTPGNAGTEYDILNPSLATTSIKFNTTGTYDVTVTVKSPYSSAPISKTESVNVTATGGGVPAERLIRDYGIVGETCLDVRNSKLSSESDAAFNARIDDFEHEDDYTKTYKFLHKYAYTDLVLSCYDVPEDIVESIDLTSLPSNADAASGTKDDDGNYVKEFKIKFNSNIKNLVSQNGDSLTVRLVASYKPEGNSDTKLAYLEIRVENGTCVCPAKVSSSPETWLNFMCHNLGGLDIISPSQLITRAHHGDWYMFGAYEASVKNTPTHDTDQLWDNNYCYSNLEDVWANDGVPPCPAGWRMTKKEEWQAVINASNNAPSNIPEQWYPENTKEFRNLKGFGNYLYLPAAGHRDTSNRLQSRARVGYYRTLQGLSGTHRGYFMSFSKSDAGCDNHDFAQFGFSVRCVAAE
jgi:uncharacterized protein (TIGR02145 family)